MPEEGEQEMRMKKKKCLESQKKRGVDFSRNGHNPIETSDACMRIAHRRAVIRLQR